MGKPSAPSPPDPVATANAQATSNVNTAAAQAALNNVNQYTPYGATTYNQSGTYTTPDGQVVPTYSQNTELSPLGQSILTGQQGVANSVVPAAQTLANQVGGASTTPLTGNTPFSGTLNNWQQAGHGLDTGLSATINGGADAIRSQQSPSDWLLNATPGAVASAQHTPFDPTLNRGPQLLSQDTSNAIYDQQKSYLDPQWAQQGTQLQDQLSRQGIPIGSEAYANATKMLDNGRNQAYQSARDSAIAGGTGAASNLFNMALSGKQQQIGQADTAFQEALQNKQQGLGQLQSAIQAALSGQQLNNAQQNQAFNQALSGQQQNLSQQQMFQQQPIALLGQLMGAAPATPSQPLATPVPGQIAPTDVIGATGLSQNAANSAYQTNSANTNAAIGGAASLAGTAALAVAM